MPIYVFSKTGSFLIRIEYMETAPIKYQPKRGSRKRCGQDAFHQEAAAGLSLGRFLLGSLDCQLRGVDTQNTEALLRKPDRVIPGSASDIDGGTRLYGQRSYGLNEVEIGLADVPRSV